MFTSRSRRFYLFGTALSFIILALICGVIWGMCRHPYTLSRDDSKQVTVSALSDGVEFQNFGTYYLFVLGLSIIVGLCFMFRGRYTVAGLIACGLWALITAAIVWVIGGIVGSMRYPSLNPQNISPNTWVHVLPAMSPGLTLIIAPALSMTLYWAGALGHMVSPDEEEKAAVASS